MNNLIILISLVSNICIDFYHSLIGKIIYFSLIKRPNLRFSWTRQAISKWNNIKTEKKNQKQRPHYCCHVINFLLALIDGIPLNFKKRGLIARV